MTPISSKVESIEPLTDIVSKVVLNPAVPLDFKAGQYIQVCMTEEDQRPFSIANAPRDDHRLELHIGVEAGNPYAGEVLARMHEQGEVLINGAHGKAYLREQKIKPTILLAGGTGFSYAYSILQRRLALPSKEPIFMYWGTQTLADMYAYEKLNKLHQQYKHFKFHPVVDNPDTNWQGRKGWVHLAVLQDFVSLEPYQVYVAGRFEMAGVAREDFHNKGLLMENLYGDAYQFI